MPGLPPSHRAGPGSRLAVCVSILAARDVVPRWCATLIESIDAHPALELRALAHRIDATAPPAPHSPTECAVGALLHRIDRPLLAVDPPADAPSTVPCDARALAACEVLLELDARDGPGAPVERRLAPGQRLWRIEAWRVAAETEASLLGGFDVVDLVLRERRAGTGTDGLAPERPHAVHALPAQSFSRQDRATAAFGALPTFVTSALVRLQAGIAEPVPDTVRLFARERLLYLDRPAGERRRVARRRLRAALRLMVRHASTRALDRFTEERWELAWCPDPFARGTGIEGLLERPVSAWHPLLDVPGRLRADPHALSDEGAIDLWFEDMAPGSDRAHVSHAALRWLPGTDGGDGTVAVRPGGGATALESPHHLSYPFVFEHAGARWMVPETASVGRIELYREDGSPGRWRLDRTLVEGIDATDTTLLRRDGTWWLFTSAMSHPAVDERDLLLLYRADALAGPWRAHPANPVVRGVEGARMAGALFEVDGMLVRPSQYGARRYGHGLNLNRIDRLDDEGYAETLLGRVVPDGTGGWLGLHSFSRAGGVAFADRLRRRPRSASRPWAAAGSDPVKPLIRKTYSSR